jgi:hypothetical protein
LNLSKVLKIGMNIKRNCREKTHCGTDLQTRKQGHVATKL